MEQGISCSEKDLKVIGLETHEVLYKEPLHHIFHHTQHLYKELTKRLPEIWDSSSELDNHASLILHARFRLGGLWFVIHDKVLNFCDWILHYYELSYDKIKRYVKAIWTLWTLKYQDYVLFCCIDSFPTVHNQAK